MKKLLSGVVFIGFLAVISPAFAGIDTVRFQEKLNEMNRLKPMQNPANETSAEILRRRVIDQKNKVIGQVTDVLVKADGGVVTSLEVDFDRLRLGQSVFLNYRDMKIRSASNGYQLSMNAEEVAGIYPELLAGIEAASGEENEILSVKALIGKPVTRPDGRRIGEIEDVLFSNNGSKVQAVFVNVDSGSMRDVGVAVPLIALNVKNDRGRVRAELPDDQADILTKFSEKK